MTRFTSIVQKQRDFFSKDATRPLAFRIDVLRRLKSAIQKRESQWYAAIAADFGKSRFDTYTTEFGLLYGDIDETIKELPRWSRRRRVRTNLANLPGRSYLIPEPLGVCLVIGAWNYPYLLSLSPVVAALAAGNTAILKPSELPAATSQAMREMVAAEFEPELFSVVEGGVSETTELLEERFDKIFFTGSPAVGRIVYMAAAKQMTPVTLELGGKSPAIVAKDSQLQHAAKRIVWGKFLNAGQTCVAPDYLLVDRSVQDELLEQLRRCIERFQYKVENNNYPRIINERNFRRLADLIDPAKVVVGGMCDESSYTISPTILRDVTLDDRVMQEEIFGPILPVIGYSDVDEAIAAVRSLPKPLACYIFTHDTVLRDRLLGRLSFGGGAVNDTLMHLSNNNLPFGGVGNSGIGSYHGEAGFRAFSHNKSVLDKPFWFEPDFKYPPYSERKLKWIKWLLG
ncbi:MAG: aldehyde dehydrogenase [Pirellulaceae bacterium]|nr:aldehyde dehydrogenase [Planctomycetales bacterium]